MSEDEKLIKEIKEQIEKLKQDILQKEAILTELFDAIEKSSQ